MWHAPPVLPALISVTPPSAIQIGPLPIGFYGLGYVVGIAVMLLVSQGEARRRGYDPGLVTGALVTVAICAIVGARLYHVIDQWLYYRDHLTAIVLPPYSGLGLYGGIAGAVVGIAIHCRRHRLPFLGALDVVVPGTLFAQAIARWGNFFNQELYGPPTELPWGITIDCDHRVAQYPCDTYPAATTGFGPLFLYESIWDALGGGRRPVAVAPPPRPIAGRGPGQLLDDLVRQRSAGPGVVPAGLGVDRRGHPDRDAHRRHAGGARRGDDRPTARASGACLTRTATAGRTR